MNVTKTQPTNLVLVLPGQPVSFDLVDETLIVSATQIGGVMKMEYRIIRKIPSLLDCQKN